MFSMILHNRGWLLGLVFSVLVGCAPVRDWNPLDYSVKAGDTLYSIAWRYEVDFLDIARWNNISSPYAIYPGQRLKLSVDDASGSFGHETIMTEQPASSSNSTTDESAAVVSVVEMPASDVLESNRSDAVVVQKGDTLFSIAQKHGLNHSQLARWNALHPPYALHVGQTLRLTPPTDRYAIVIAADKSSIKTDTKTPGQSVAIAPVIDKRPVVATDSKPVKWTAVSTWHWPVRGRVIKTFNSNDTARKGIGIAGKAGQPVLAAAGGRVVYSGNGLISYGNLIIIKHDDNYLSAYAHNQELLVAEGDDVKADQLIARMGKNNGRAQLHFEIRKNGKPVNPLQYLPQG
jgi:lipoprotein NlpD